MARQAPSTHETVRRNRSANRFDGATPGTSVMHAHDGGQFILVETGISHLRTEFGAWIIPARRVGWVPPGVRHASRSSGRGGGWVVIAPVEIVGSLPRQVRVLRTSALMMASLERLTRLASSDAHLRRLLWKVIVAEMREAEPEQLEVPMPNAPRMLKAAQSILRRPSMTADVDRLAVRAGMSRRSFTRHFKNETGLSFTRWKRVVIAHHALERIAAGHKVSSVAFDMGYESVSAFIAMFRRQYGAAPRRFLSEHSEEYLNRPEV